MNEIVQAPAPGIGDNIPPTDIDPLRARLYEDHADLFKRRDEVLVQARSLPPVIKDDDVEARFTETMKDMRAHTKNAEAIRVKEKEFFLEGGRTVDGVLRDAMEEPDKERSRLNGMVTRYKQVKAEEERQRRLEEERRAREEADRLAKEAAAKEAAVQTEADLDAAVSAAQTATQADVEAIKARHAAAAKPADLSRSRTSTGVLSSLQRVVKHDPDSLVIADLDLEKLRFHIPEDAYHQAIRSLIAAGVRKLDGVRIYETTENRTR